MKLTKDQNNIGILLLVSLLFYVPFLGQVHLFDWDEINFAECAREMIVTGDYLNVQINFQPFWEKPPFFIWLQVLSMKLFGINEFAARFPNAVCGIVTLIVLYFSGKRVKDEKLGMIWALVYASSILPFFYFKSGIIDPWFNLFIFAGFWRFIVYADNKNRLINALLSGIFIGLAVITKGPAALVIFGLAVFVYLIYSRFRIKTSISNILAFTLALLLSGGSWFILQLLNGNYQTIYDFIVYQIRLIQTQDAGHGGFPGYHFVVMLIGVFPAVVFALKGFFKNPNMSGREKLFHTNMNILFGVVIILFSIVKTKIVHYSSLCYFPLTFMAAERIYAILFRGEKIKIFEKVYFITLSILYILIVSGLTQIEKYKHIIIDKIADKFAAGNLTANANWTGLEIIAPILLLTGLIISLIILKHKGYLQFFKSVAATFLVFTFATVFFITPRVEEYSQNAAIEFYKDKAGEDCYVETIGFKSYADIFYFNKQKVDDKKMLDWNWLGAGPIDKTVYIVSKNTHKKGILESFPKLEIINEKNGWVFYKREPEILKYNKGASKK